MQTVSSQFTERTNAVMRPITHRVLISWDKNFDDAIDFFTIGSSSIGGSDLLKGDANTLQQWDKYVYQDYTDRILSIEINRETDPPNSPLTFASATIVLDNHDDLFTSGAGGALNDYLLPRRPIRINAGFGGETIPKFVGITDSKPIVDEKSKTVTLNCIDFLRAIMDVTLDEEIMYIDSTTDEIVGGLFETGGLDPSQFDLDAGSVVIPFAYFEKGSKLGDGLREVAEAELGNVSMTEAGVPRFQNRSSWAANTNVWDLDKSNVLEKKTAGTDSVINVVEVISQVRAVQDNQKLWEAPAPIDLPAGVQTEIFIDFEDDNGSLPVTTADDPLYVASATTSFYETNYLEDGSGATGSGDVSLVSSDLFSTALKLVFNNSGSASVFLIRLEIFGTPAKVIDNIYVRSADPTSIGINDGYEEHPIKIENNLIQDEVAATSIGMRIIQDRAEDDDQQTFLVKSIPQLQIGDVITYSDENIAGETYFVARINDIINTSGYRQLLHGTKRTIHEYFAIAVSTIGGTDELAP